MCDPVSGTALAVTALGTSMYGAHEARKQARSQSRATNRALAEMTAASAPGETLKQVDAQTNRSRTKALRAMALRRGLGSTNVTGGALGSFTGTGKSLLGQ